MHGPWTTAHLANRTHEDVMVLAAAVAMDLAKVPVDLPYGLTAVTCGDGQFWGSAVVRVAKDAGVARPTRETDEDVTLPVVLENRRFSLDWQHVSEGRRMMVVLEFVDVIQPDTARELLKDARAYRLRLDLVFLRHFMKAWYGVDDAALDVLGLDEMRGTPHAWSQFDCRNLATAVFGKRTLPQALVYVADKLADLEPGREDDGDHAAVDQHHDHDVREAKPIAAAAESVVRRLSEMTGFGEEATTWGMDLARDLRDYASGEIGWADVDKGLLLSGPPGCGKTTFARSVAMECGVRFVASGYSAWEGAMTGTGYIVRAMKKTFDEWRKMAKDGKGPLLVLWDELDTMGRRGQGGHNAGYWDGVVNATLDFLDGGEPREGIVVIGCTNHPDKVDEALKRPGRLDRTLVLPPPSREALRGILAAHLRVDAHAPGMDEATRAVGGRTPAEVEQAVRDARRHARRLRRAATPDDVTEIVVAQDAVFERDVMWRSTVHEAGHAVAAFALGLDVVELHQHLCIVRSQAMSTPRRMLDEICYTLAAGAAEEALLGTVSTGRKVDLSDATRDAALYHASYGFGGTLTHAFRGEHGSSEVTLTPELAARVEATLAEQWERVRDLVRGRVVRIDRLARRLAVVRHMTGDEIRECLRLDFGPLARGCDRRWEVQADEYDAVPMAA